MPKSDSGKFGENYTRDRLWHAGYELIAQNYRTRHGEVDLIMRDGDFLVFIEVKTRSLGSYGRPGESVGYHKQQRILHAAQEFLLGNYTGLQPRFDVAEVIIAAPDNLLVMEFEYIEDAFGR